MKARFAAAAITSVVALTALFGPAVGTAAPMSFRTYPDTPIGRAMRETFDGGRERVFASGEIQADTAEKLRAFLASKHIELAGCT